MTCLVGVGVRACGGGGYGPGCGLGDCVGNGAGRADDGKVLPFISEGGAGEKGESKGDNGAELHFDCGPGAGDGVS